MLDSINLLAQEIIKEEEENNLYKQQLEEKEEHNYLYKIDKDDREFFKQNENTLHQKKMKLKNMIYNHIFSLSRNNI